MVIIVKGIFRRLQNNVLISIIMQIKKLQKLTVVVFILWIIAQAIVAFVFQDIDQWLDGKNYMRHALYHYQNGTLYPTAHNLYDIYIQALGFVNWLVVVLHIFGDIKGNLVMNVLINIAICCETFYLAKRFFNEKVAYYAVILYCLISSNLFMPLHINSDMPSLFFGLTGFCLALNKRWYFLLLGSIFLGYTHSIRPYELAFLVPLFGYMIIHKYRWYKYLLLIIPYVLIIYGIGSYSKSQTGVFITASYTKGYGNLKIALGNGKKSADNDIYYVKSHPLYQGLPNTYTFIQKDSIWRERAKTGMKKNRLNYILYWPNRVLHLYKVDNFPTLFLIRGENALVGNKTPILKKGLIIILHIGYYLSLLLLFISLYINRKSYLSEKGLFLLMLFIMTCGFSIFGSETRYHYPCIFLICIFAAYGADTILENKKLIHK